MLRLALAVACSLGGLAACSSPSVFMCSRDSDCPSGRRCADGACTPFMEHEAGPADVLRSEARLDGTEPPRDGLSPDGVVSCPANHDDQIARSEMTIKAGTSVKYTVGSGLTLDLQGTKVQGRTQWDLTANASDEHPYLAELEPVASWAAADFPGATYMSLLDAGYQTYGVFTATQTALQMTGVISKTADQTKLSYSSRVDTMRFPIVVKDSFKTDAIVTGYMYMPEYLMTMPISNHETYDVSVLDAGSLELPELTLDALLIKMVVTQNPTVNPWLITTRVSFLFVAECYGIVAQVFTDEDPSDLTKVLATERRRISK